MDLVILTIILMGLLVLAVLVPLLVSIHRDLAELLIAVRALNYRQIRNGTYQMPHSSKTPR